jgi:hypothetical protein
MATIDILRPESQNGSPPTPEQEAAQTPTIHDENETRRRSQNDRVGDQVAPALRLVRISADKTPGGLRNANA